MKKRRDKSQTKRRSAARGKAAAAGGQRQAGRRAWNTGATAALFVLVSLGVGAYLEQISPRVADFDYFYHLRHASMYAREGLFFSEFPWAVYSVIGRYGADIWYGFHLLLLGVTWIDNPIGQLRVAPIFVFVIFCVTFYGAARRGRLAYPYVWPFLLCFGAAVFTQRLVQARPHIVSMGLSGLLLATMIYGSVWGVFATALALSFIHLAFFWLALLIGAGCILGARIFEKRWEWKKGAALVAGLAAGGALRPNALGAAKILYVQVFALVSEQRQGLAGFGTELGPLEPKALFLLGPFILVWLGFTVLAVAGWRRARLEKREKIMLTASFLFSCLFFVSTMLLYKRTVDQWALFSVIFIAAGFTYFVDPGRGDNGGVFLRSKTCKVLAAVGVVILLGMAGLTDYSYKLFMHRPGAGRPLRLQAAAGWLAQESEPGKIVFHAHWDTFPDLFFWNARNRYIGGMDPIFQFAYDKELYWKARHLATNEAGGRTWGSRELEGARLQDTFAVLRRDFAASYLLVQKYRTPRLYSYAKADKRFTERYDDGRVVVFELSGQGLTN